MKARLFTNLDYVAVVVEPAQSGLRCNASALLIEGPDERFEADGPMGRSWRLRAFGPDPAWPVFDYRLKADDGLDYEQRRHEGSVRMLKQDGSLEPITNGSVLFFPEGLGVALYAEDTQRPIQVDDFEGEASGDFFDRLWVTLAERTREFWMMPAMPMLQFVAPIACVTQTELHVKLAAQEDRRERKLGP